jgi:predicted DNA-binding WGR domain protein/ribosomal protein L34E
VNKRRLENTISRYAFLEVWTEGNVMHARWGKIGTAGQGKSWTYYSPAVAEAKAREKIRKKLAGDYRDVTPPPIATAGVAGPQSALNGPPKKKKKKKRKKTAPKCAKCGDAIEGISSWTPALCERCGKRRQAALKAHQTMRANKAKAEAEAEADKPLWLSPRRRLPKPEDER